MANNPFDELEVQMQRAIDSGDLHSIAAAVSQRARVLAEFAPVASAEQLKTTDRQGQEVEEILRAERQRIFSGVRDSRRLQRALELNIDTPAPFSRVSG